MKENENKLRADIIRELLDYDGNAQQFTDNIISSVKANPLDAMVGLPLNLLIELMDACKPYRSRKKGTPREDCRKLNKVYAKCETILELQGTPEDTIEPNTLEEIEKHLALLSSCVRNWGNGGGKLEVFESGVR